MGRAVTACAQAKFMADYLSELPRRQNGGTVMRLLLKPVILVALATLMLTASPVSAREQDDDAGQCWDPDIEFPVPCDEDEE